MEFGIVMNVITILKEIMFAIIMPLWSRDSNNFLIILWQGT